LNTHLAQKDIYSVSRLNSEARLLLESRFCIIWVEGEISNLVKPGSGHLYFSLKDPSAQIRCAMFRNRNRLLAFTPENGQKVLIQAKISLYEARGDFQLIAQSIEPAGEGALRQAFEALKLTLSNEGLFDPAHKKPLPPLPERVGIITSPTGAAVKDILTVLQRRFPPLGVTIYPTLVQGDDAAIAIIKAIKLANQQKTCDLLILARGGGSIEDLWAFNNEQLAREIFKSKLPIVTGIGHEIDFTIADLVADVRAPTPSVAAETISPDQNEILSRLELNFLRLQKTLVNKLTQQKTQMNWLSERLAQQHPSSRLEQHSQRIDELAIRLKQRFSMQLTLRTTVLLKTVADLKRNNPVSTISSYLKQTSNLASRLKSAMSKNLESSRYSLGILSRTLDSVSPLATLDRGYSILSSCKNRSLISKTAQVKPGDEIAARVSDGNIICTVSKTVK